MLFTSIKLSDVENLEQIFAVMTSNGWIIPTWLKVLRAKASTPRGV